MTTRVLVTGGAGYVGSHACKALAAAGFTPVVLDDFSTGNRWAVRWGPLVEADLADRAAVAGAVRAHDVRAVLHFAGFSDVAASVADPGACFRTNLGGGLALLDAMAETGVDKLVLSSSCAVYGAPERLPVAEAAPRAPTSPYGAAKTMLEDLARWHGAAHGLAWCALRYFNAAGADPAGEIGEWRDPEWRLIPIAVEAALGLRDGVSVMGDDYPTADGAAVRDFVHVSDLAAAHVAALERLIAGGAPTAINLGAGRGHSVREVIRAVAAAAGRTPTTRTAQRRPGDPPALVADIGYAQAELGWRPKMSDLKRIVETAVAWRRDHFPTVRTT